MVKKRGHSVYTVHKKFKQNLFHRKKVALEINDIKVEFESYLTGKIKIFLENLTKLRNSIEITTIEPEILIKKNVLIDYLNDLILRNNLILKNIFSDLEALKQYTLSTSILQPKELINKLEQKRLMLKRDILIIEKENSNIEIDVDKFLDMVKNEQEKCLFYEATANKKLESLIKSLSREVNKVKEQLKNDLCLAENILDYNVFDDYWMFTTNENLDLVPEFLKLKMNVFLSTEKAFFNENFPVLKKQLNLNLDLKFESLVTSLTEEFHKIKENAASVFIYQNFMFNCNQRISKLTNFFEEAVREIGNEHTYMLGDIKERMQKLIRLSKKKGPKLYFRTRCNKKRFILGNSRCSYCL